MSKLVLTDLGWSDKIRLAAADAGTPGPGEVLVSMAAAAIEPVDFLYANGWYWQQPSLPQALGGTGVGRVTQLGAGVDTDLAGKRVIILPMYTQGTWADQVVAKADSVYVVPETLDTGQAAFLAVNPATAYFLLHKYTQLNPGDWIGQNLGNSALGTQIIALAKRAGLKTLSVVRSAAAAEQIKALGADLVVVDGDDLAERIVTQLGSARFKLVLDGRADGSVNALALGLAPHGSVVTYSTVTNDAPKPTLETIMFRDACLRGFWLENWTRGLPQEEVQATYTHLAELVEQGVLSTPIEAAYPLADYEQALIHAVKPGRTGKVLFTFPNQD